MASIGRVVISALSGTQEITAGLANFNFDFSLVKVAAPNEYQSIGQHLSKKRKLSAEDGSIHRTARKLGALFEASLPDIPSLIRAYGLRASEVTENPEHKLSEERRRGPLDEHVGLDGRAHWAAATSGPSALAVLLLACMIARSFTKSTEAVALWSEIVATRKILLQEQLSGPSIHINSLTASQVEITREALAEWDASARSWLSMADKSMSRQQFKLMVIIDNLDLTVRSSLTAYENVMEVWVDAMTTVDKLISGVPLRMQKPGVLIGLSSWHLYPDISVLDYEQKLLKLDDHLIRAGGLLTIGMRSISPKITEGINWTMPLKDLRYYGKAPLTKGVVNTSSSYVTFDVFIRVAIGSMISQWSKNSSGLESIFAFLAAFGKAVTAPKVATAKQTMDQEVMDGLAFNIKSLEDKELDGSDNKELNGNMDTDLSDKVFWSKTITDVADSYPRGNDYYKKEVEQSVELGIRRFSNFFAPKREHSHPGFGLCTIQTLLDMMSPEGTIPALRALTASNYPTLDLKRAVLLHKGDDWSEIIDLSSFKNPRKPELSYRRWVILHDSETDKSTENKLPWQLRMTHYRNKDSNSPYDHGTADISRAVHILKDLKESCGFVTSSQTVSVQPTRWNAYDLFSWAKETEEELENIGRGLLVEKHTPFWLRSDYNRVWNSPSQSLFLFLPVIAAGTFSAAIDVPLDFLTGILDQGLLPGSALRRYMMHLPWHESNKQTFTYFRSLTVLNSVSTLYETLQGALVNLSVLSMPLRDMKWRTERFESLDPPQALSCISTFATGYHNLDPSIFSGIIGLSYNNALYMREFLLNDPWQNFRPGKSEQTLCCLVGTIDHPGLSLLVPVAETMRSEPDLESWKLINHHDFDGRVEDNFSGTALQLCLTGYVQPIDTGEHGTRDKDTFFVETVISVHERGSWIADINVLSLSPQDGDQDADDDENDERTLNISLPESCTHSAIERSLRELSCRLRSVDNWTEFLDLPSDLCIVLDAIYTHTSTFMSRTEWREGPLSQLEPTYLQDLLYRASPISTILEQLDTTQVNAKNAALVIVERALAQLATVIESLDDWYVKVRSENFDFSAFQSSDEVCDPRMRFPNLTTANCMSHFWAFKILCISEIAYLKWQYPGLAAKVVDFGSDTLDSESYPNEVKCMSNWIMGSTEYLTQDYMKLFGVLSTYFPVHTVFATLLRYERITKNPSLLNAFAGQHRSLIKTLMELGCISPLVSHLSDYDGPQVSLV
ncbi:uncharacterized protein N0V89_000176 [Didymosphaeria variabile]|uniref:Uncharacterized protein n=1 Tax=Didymosphaeria variabile TaxID=1932322 RepID=A0A9W8XUT6_9PLEO|nr:uncharacterized protein N0V89_000176 [Didymosphaeria variabile]KAJ4359621.1 hypothetical protein N0V89_000176 [Didymosphaeria variabile]